MSFKLFPSVCFAVSMSHDHVIIFRITLVQSYIYHSVDIPALFTKITLKVLSLTINYRSLVFPVCSYKMYGVLSHSTIIDEIKKLKKSEIL